VVVSFLVGIGSFFGCSRRVEAREGEVPVVFEYRRCCFFPGYG